MSVSQAEVGDKPPTAAYLKKSCDGYLGILARRYKELEVLIGDINNRDAVIKKYGQLEGISDSYESRFAEWHARLEGQPAESALEQFELNMLNRTEFGKRIGDWIEDSKPQDVSTPPPITPKTGQMNDDNMSVISAARSRASNQSDASSTSSVRIKEAKAKMELAKLKREQLKKTHQLQEEQRLLEQRLAQMELDNEIAEADVELQIWDTNGDPGNMGPVKPPVTRTCNDVGVNEGTPRPTHSPGLNPNVREWSQRKTTTSDVVPQDMSQLFQTLNLSVNMPKAEITQFNGNPVSYWTFINSFDVNIANKTTDDRVRLMYLMQLCVGEVKESIECCVLMDPQQGYQKAREILADQYGQPHVVVHALIGEILNRSQIRPNDANGLSELARKMRRCDITLTQMGYTADLNSSDSLLKIHKLMPIYMQSDWAKRAQKMMAKGEVPNFSHMTEFIEDHTRVCNTIYGKNVNSRPSAPKDGSRSDRPSRQFGRTGVTTLSTQGHQEEGQANPMQAKCQCCSEQHWISNCKIFKSKPQRERFKIIRKYKLCDNCFKRFHLAGACFAPPQCRVDGCGKRHHTLLHYAPSVDERVNSSTGVGEPKPEGRSHGVSLSMVSTRKVCLRVLPVHVYANNKTVMTWALLDEGSDTSLCEEGLARELCIKGKIEEFELTTVNGTGEVRHGSEVSLCVKGKQGGELIEIPRVWTVDSIPVSHRSVPSQADLDKWPHLKGIELPTIEDKEVRLLIGSDTPEAFWIMDERRGRQKEPYAVLSPLGWTLLGPMSNDKSNRSFAVNHISHDPLQDQLKRFWEIDHSLGRCDDEKIGESVEDSRARHIMEQSIVHVDGHYQIGLPWRHHPPYLPNNRRLAENRLQGLERRFGKDTDLHQRYKGCIDDYISKGHAIEIDTGKRDDLDEKSREGRVWYLPHHPVTNPMKPDKLRVVFDCAAHFKGVALNTQLLQGPDYTNNLVGVLTRFRQNNIAIISDIEGMFHQVRVQPEDTDALRFLWWEDGNPMKPVKDYKMTVHLFGATSSPSCAGFALHRTVEDNKQDFDKGVENIVNDNFYVDDCLASVGSVKEGKRLIPQLCDMLKRGGFRLTKWVSNSVDLLSIVPRTERAKSMVDLDLDHMSSQRTLGIMWNVETDTFGFKVSIKASPCTRRGILSAASSLYDPLGFVAPFTLNAKILLQDLCSQELGWDQPIGSLELQRWQDWLAELPGLKSVKIERCLKPPHFENVIYDLHVFGDASERAYAASAYLRVVDSTGEVHCGFVMGKSRLSPLKVVTIPRLELSAAVLAVTMGQMILEEVRVPVRNVTYWTDSTSVLLYIQNESRRFRTFVANRVAKIHAASKVSQWRHVDSGSNPADDGSRGMHSKDISKQCRWLNGPAFLWAEEEFWPATPPVVSKATNLETDDLQSSLEVKVAKTYLAVTTDPMLALLERYSTWGRLKRGVAWILRYKKFLLSRSKGKSSNMSKILSVQDLREAEREIIKLVQRNVFSDEIDYAQRETPSRGRKGSALNRLNPILVDGVLRVGGRLRNAPISDDARHPVILPQNHHVTKLIIEYYHLLVGHSGAGMTWSSVRSKYWVLRGGASVRHVIGKCFSCKRRNAPSGKQLMGELPAARVTPDKGPFTNVGIDFFGPLYVKQGRSEVKKYGCIFTCLTVRAVHIELADDLSTDSFLNALRRFMCRRGSPEKIFSDNGSNFKGGERELREAVKALNTTKVGSFLLGREIEWHFNPPTASHMGGVWERMIQSVRRILKSLLGEQIVSQEVLTTVLAEVESILNARPLTQLSMDPTDEAPLTPNHLLLMKNSPSVPPGVFSKTDVYGRRRWRQSQYLAEQFWKRWLKDYLPLLQIRRKWHSLKRNFQIDDLVLMVEDHVPRGKWSMGRVVQVFPDKAGNVRQVEVRASSKYYRRPIAKLCLLEGVIDN